MKIQKAFSILLLISIVGVSIHSAGDIFVTKIINKTSESIWLTYEGFENNIEEITKNYLKENGKIVAYNLENEDVKKAYERFKKKIDRTISFEEFIAYKKGKIKDKAFYSLKSRNTLVKVIPKGEEVELHLPIASFSLQEVGDFGPIYETRSVNALLGIYMPDYISLQLEEILKIAVVSYNYLPEKPVCLWYYYADFPGDMPLIKELKEVCQRNPESYGSWEDELSYIPRITLPEGFNPALRDMGLEFTIHSVPTQKDSPSKVYITAEGKF